MSDKPPGHLHSVDDPAFAASRVAGDRVDDQRDVAGELAPELAEIRRRLEQRLADPARFTHDERDNCETILARLSGDGLLNDQEYRHLSRSLNLHR